MIVVDSSALVAILIAEPDGPKFLEMMQSAERVVMSAVNVHETGMVLRARLGPGGIEDLYDLIAALDIDVLPFGLQDTRSALAAFENYGKGIVPKARLNLCDCVAYSLAKKLNAPLLFKGHDFSATDVQAY